MRLTLPLRNIVHSQSQRWPCCFFLGVVDARRSQARQAEVRRCEASAASMPRASGRAGVFNNSTFALSSLPSLTFLNLHPRSQATLHTPKLLTFSRSRAHSRSSVASSHKQRLPHATPISPSRSSLSALHSSPHHPRQIAEAHADAKERGRGRGW